VSALFRNYVAQYADGMESDVHGNVWGALNPSAEMRIMLAGHTDEIGFIVHYIGDDGLLRFKTIGGHDSAVPAGQRVWVHGRERVPGVIGRKAIHLLEDDEESKKKPEVTDMWIDIGASSREQAEALVELGDVATFVHEFQTLAGSRAAGRGFDDKVGAFVVAETLRTLREDGGLPEGVGLFAVGTVQEEVGFRGATTATYAIDPHVGIAVDVSHATDTPSVSAERHGRLEIAKGPAITRGAYVNPTVFRMLMDAAREEGLPVQVEVAAECTGTDATPMQVNRGGVAVGLVGVPLRYMHTPSEVLDLQDVENTVRLLVAFCRRVRPDTDFRPLA